MGPLEGVRIVEFSGIGPGPLAGMILADMGAAVTVVERPGGGGLAGLLAQAGPNLLNRGKRSLVLDLKSSEGVALALRLVERADALVEGNRPGVMERLGLGPEACAARNPRLVYGRMTGWGQEGPLARAAGHDLNYVALAGALALSGREGAAPAAPPTLVGDAPGGLSLAFGIVCAVLEARRSGRGQVVDAAIVDAVAYLGALLHSMQALGALAPQGPRLLGGDAPFYEAYPCADGRFVTLAALEPAFYRLLLDRLGLADLDPSAQYDPAEWPALRARLAGLIRTRTQAEWCALLEGSDVCFAPVLAPEEAAEHPHLRARGTYLRVDGVLQAAPAPRFSRSTPGPVPPPPRPGADGPALLAELGLGAAEVDGLRRRGVVG
jgi:alpha-methylacyl-CoA racemase